MAFTIKIRNEDITIGPPMGTPDLIAAAIAAELVKMGYYRTSNAFCTIARIDRDDWLDILSKKLNCCKADFYMPDGSGISQNWVDHYVRSYSKDVQTVAPEVLRHVRPAR